MYLKWLVREDGYRVKSEDLHKLIVPSDTVETLCDKFTENKWMYMDFYMSLHECCEYELIKSELKNKMKLAPNLK